MHGLFLEGASWEEGKGGEEGCIADSKYDYFPLVLRTNSSSERVFVVDFFIFFFCHKMEKQVEGSAPPHAHRERIRASSERHELGVYVRVPDLHYVHARRHLPHQGTFTISHFTV